MTSLWQWWQATAVRHAEKTVAIDADSGQMKTCAQLTADAERLALSLRGPFIPINQPNSHEWLVTFLAIQKIGAAALPLDPSLPAEARHEAIHRIGARLPQGRCCVKLTSGTTGELKPIFCAAQHLVADGQHICATMGIKSSDRNLALIPLGHSYGLGNLVMPLILQATPVVLGRTIVPRQILQWIRDNGVTVFPTVPAVLRALAQLQGAQRPSTLRLVISAGAPLSPMVARQFYDRYGLKVHNFYGASETGGICYDATGNASLSGRSVGKPLDGVRVEIRRDGRVIVRSRAVVGPGRRVLTDLGEWNRYGELRLLGRVGLVANIGGKKVAPAKVERALRAARGVSDAWVTVLKDARGHDYLAAAIETERSRAEIEADLGRRLSPWQFPKRYFIARALPRTDRGKLDAASLRARLEPGAPALL